MTPPRPYLCYCPACGCPGIIWDRTGNSIGAELCTDGNYAGGMIPDEDALLIHPFCQHYIWREELLYDWPRSLKLKAVTVGEPGLQAFEPHPAYLIFERNEAFRETLYSMAEDWDRKQYYQKYFDIFEPLKNLLRSLLKLQEDPELELDNVIGGHAWEAAWQLGVAGVEAESKRFLLRRWWWSINHVQGSWDDDTDEYIQPPPPDQLMLTRCLKTLLPLLTEPEHQLDKAEALRELGDFEAAALCYHAIDPSSLDELDQMRYPLIGRLIEEGSTELKYAESQGYTMFL